MYIVIKSDEASHLESKIHKVMACLGEIVDALHNAKHVSHMPEEYRHSGFDTRSEQHRYPMEDRTRMTHEPYYPPRDGYHDPYRERDFEDRGRGRY